MIKSEKVVDLSHTLLPGKEEYRLEVKNKFVEEFLPGYSRSKEDWYIMSEIIIWSHVGTHLEAPFHYLKEGKDVSEVPLSRLMGEAVILDFSHKKTNEPIEREELEEVGKR
jgi:arylformamidase